MKSQAETKSAGKKQARSSATREISQIEGLALPDALVQPIGLNGLPGDSTARSLRQAAVLQMQERQGNRAVRRHLTDPDSFRVPSLQRQGTAGNGTEGVDFRGKWLSNNVGQLRTVLDQVATQGGLKAARKFVDDFANTARRARSSLAETGNTPGTGGGSGAGPGTEVTPSSEADAQLQVSISEKLEGAYNELELYRDRMTLTFEGNAKTFVGALLDESKAQIEKEKERYGISKQGEGDFAARRGGETAQLKMAVKKLIEAKTELMNMEIKLREQARKKHPAGPMERQEQEHLINAEVYSNPELIAAVLSYEALFKATASRFPMMAAFQDEAPGMAAMAQLGQNPEATALIGNKLEEKLENIETTRKNIESGKLSIWSLPNIVAGAKGQSGLAEGSLDGRLIDEKAATVKAKKEGRDAALAALTLSLGVVGAIATGGGSLVAAGVMGAELGISLAQFKEHLEHYQMMEQAGDTSLDQAKSIAEEDPGLMWLAFDLLAIGLDVHGAKALFKTIRGPLRQAAKELATEGDPRVMAGKGPGVKALKQATAGHSGLFKRIMARISKVVGDPSQLAAARNRIKATLNAIMGQFRKLDPGRVNAKLAEAFNSAADELLAKGKVVVVPSSPVEQMEALKNIVKNHVTEGGDVVIESKFLFKKLNEPGTQGLYDSVLGIIVLKGDASPSSVAAYLAHELAHYKQDLTGLLKDMSKFEAEFQAYVAQREYLMMLPGELVPVDHEWLLKATLDDIEKHVLDHYADVARPAGFDRDAAVKRIFELLTQGERTH